LIKIVKKKPGNGRLNNLNDPVLSVLRFVLRIKYYGEEEVWKTYSTCDNL